MRRDKKMCAWAQLLEDESLQDDTSVAAKQFRQGFRVPYPFFLRLVEVVKRKGWFPKGEQDAVGRPCHPMEHKVSSTLWQVVWRFIMSYFILYSSRATVCSLLFKTT